MKYRAKLRAVALPFSAPLLNPALKKASHTDRQTRLDVCYTRAFSSRTNTATFWAARKLPFSSLTT